MDIEEMTAEILKSKKYRNVDERVVKRICADAIRRYPKKKEAVKAVKTELHRIHESFLFDESHRKASGLLDSLPSENNPEKRKKLLLDIMNLHVSTKERLEDYSEIYAFISKYITSDTTVADIGCGFNPFAVTMLNQRPKSYTAYDINLETIALLNRYFTEFPAYQAELLDIASDTPEPYTDVALILKLLPLLQQQRKNRARELLSELRFQIAVVSFPIKSLSGKQKGMEAFYAAFLDEILPDGLSIIDKRTFSNEMFYVIEKSR